MESRRCGLENPAEAVRLAPQSGPGVAGRVHAWAVREGVAQKGDEDDVFSVRAANGER